jgi:ATP-dependent DNA helicase RecQ
MEHDMQAKLIQTNDAFSLYNLSEVRYFLSQLNLVENVFTISDDEWEHAKRVLNNQFRNSKAGSMQ